MAELLKAKEVYNSVVDKTIDYTENAILRTPVEYDHSDTINPDKDMSIVGTASDIVLTLGTAPYEGYELPITNMASTGSCYVVFRAPNYSYTCIAIANQQTIKLRGVMEGRWELGNDETLAVYNLSNKPTGYDTPNDWKTFYGMGAHQFAYAGSGLDTSYSLPATDCIVTTAWQSVTQATAICSSGESVWVNVAVNSTWGTWKEAGGQIFYVTYNGSTADKTYTEIINAFGSGKIPVVKWENNLYILASNLPNALNYPQIIFSKVANYEWRYSAIHYDGIQTLNTLVCLSDNTWISNSFEFQQKLNASTGITISDNTIKAQAEYLTLNYPSDAPNLSWSTIQSLDHSLRESPFKAGSYGDTSNGYGRLWLFQRNNNGSGTAKYVDLWSIWKNKNSKNNLLLRYGRTNSQSIEYSDYYIPPIKDTITSDSTFSVSGAMFKDISPSNSDINITLQHDGSLLYDNITIQNKHNTSYKAIITYSNKDGVSSTISLSADQWAKFVWNGTGFICEHIIPLSGIDDNGNAFTYDVVVRD